VKLVTQPSRKICTGSNRFQTQCILYGRPISSLQEIQAYCNWPTPNIVSLFYSCF
jgi:hypothetical protein